MKCMVPETGITINPIGEMVLCCAGDNVAVSHIKDIDNLSDFFNGPIYDKLRKDFKEQNFPEQCDVCWRHYDAGRIARFDTYNKFSFPTYKEDIASPIIPIRYLEITTSNICNQMCVTCSGKYSSKWAPYEQMAVDYGLDWRNENHKFHTETYKMTTADVDKVLEIVPGLQHLTIKGGEPFADQNNIKILRKLADTNPSCRVEICTNMQLVTNTVIELLHRLDEVHLQASIDGIGELYNWIRGGNFEKTVNNINRYHNYGGRVCSVVSTVSVYNWMHLPELIDFWKDIPGVQRINMANMVTFPKYCSPLYLHDHHIQEGLDKFYNYLNSDPWVFNEQHQAYIQPNLVAHGLGNMNSCKPGLFVDEKPKWQDRMVKWIDYCHVARENNEDIWELAPYLQEYRK